MSRSAVGAWLLRVVWVLQPLAFVPLLDDATATQSPAGRVIVSVAAWATWAVVLLATFLPTTVSLTVGRLLAAVGPFAVLVASVGGSAPGWKVGVSLGASTLGALVWFSGETGIALAQGSAYGAEERFPLKPPVPSMAPAVVSWLVLAASTLFAVVFLANERWVVGIALLVLAGTGGWFVGPRFHQLSRRWIVVVPAGIVVHDPLLLVENQLFRVPSLRAVHLAPAGTEAADLTGGTAGLAVEIVLREADTVVKVGGPDQPRGVAIHVLSVLVAPTRPGRVLSAAAARKMPVG